MNNDLQTASGQSFKQTARRASGQGNREMIVGTYTPSPVEYLPHDAESRRVANWIAGVIMESDGSLHVEHVGSTSIPGCWGKGILDLLVQYNAGCLEPARHTLDRIGFQRQAGAEAFPEARPTRVGSVEYFGRTYQIHAHVFERGGDEARALVRFRDLLREDDCLRRAYESAKRAILARGLIKGNEYSDAKGEFIRRALVADGVEAVDIAFTDER